MKKRKNILKCESSRKIFDISTQSLISYDFEEYELYILTKYFIKIDTYFVKIIFKNPPVVKENIYLKLVKLMNNEIDKHDYITFEINITQFPKK